MVVEKSMRMTDGNSRLKVSEEGIFLYRNEKEIASASFISKQFPGIFLYQGNGKLIIPARLREILQDEKENISLRLDFEGEETILKFIVCEKNNCSFMRVKVETNVGKKMAGGILSISFLLHNKQIPFFMIPGAFYGTNQREKSSGKHPKLAYRQKDAKLPESSGWLMRADRSTHPIVFATFENTGIAIGVSEVYYSSSGEWGYNSLGFMTEQGGDRIIVTIGDRDWPVRLLNHRYTDGEIIEGLPSSGKVMAEICLWWGESQDRFGYESFLRAYYYSTHDFPRGGVTPRQAIQDIVKGTMEAICSETGFFYILLSENYKESFCDLAWIGILQIGQPLLEAALKVGNKDAAEYARKIISRAAREAYNPASHMFYDIYDDKKGWSKNRWSESFEHSGYINGQACYFFLRAYRNEKERGIRRKNWLQAVIPVLHHVVDLQAPDGHFGINFALKDGRVINYEGFAGCWFVAPLAMLAGEYPDAAGWALPASERGLDAYYKDLQTMELLGSPIDIHKAPDEESILAFIKGARELYRIKGEEKYLSFLERALHYNFTWKFAYNTHHRRSHICDWSSAGGDITSVHNIHIHPMGNLVAEDIYFYYKMTGDNYFYDRVRDTVLWGMQAYNREDGEFGFGKRGWMSEQLYHTHVDYQHGGDDGGAWQVFLPWGNGSILSSLSGEIPLEILEEMTQGTNKTTSRSIIQRLIRDENRNKK